MLDARWTEWGTERSGSRGQRREARGATGGSARRPAADGHGGPGWELLGGSSELGLS